MNSEHPELAEGVDIAACKEMLIIINSKPSTEDMIALYTAPHGHFRRSNGSLPAEFDVIRTELLAPYFSPRELGYLIRYNAGHNSFSKEMFDLFLRSGPNIMEYMRSGPMTRDSRYELAVTKALGESHADDRLILRAAKLREYFFGRNSIERYEENRNTHCMAIMSKELASNRNYTLAQLDMFYQVVSSDALSQEKIQSLYTEIVEERSHLLQYIIENESRKQLNLLNHKEACLYK